MAQPPLSQRIQRLERELGVPLLQRTPRPVRLTAAGHDLLARAREVLAAVDHLEVGAATWAADDRGDPGDPVGPAIRAAFARAGVDGWLHAADVDHPDAEVAVGADEPVALASVFKLPLLVTLHRAADRGRLGLDEPLDVPVDRSVGVTGLGAMSDPATLSVRDLALLMMTVSDNGAADVLLARVGRDAVAKTLAELGLGATAVTASSGDITATLARDLTRTGLGLTARAVGDAGAVAAFRTLDPDLGNRSTPRDMTALLARIWRDEAATPAGCADMRRLLRLQVSRQRLAAGFAVAGRGAQVAGKTGTLLNLRSEVGVVELPDERRYAVSVFTRSHRVDAVDPAADAVIGNVARLAVDHLAATSASAPTAVSASVPAPPEPGSGPASRY